MNKVGVIMGSKSDYPVMEEAISILKDLNIKHEVNIVSAHRTPDKMMNYSKNASKNGIGVIIAVLEVLLTFQVWLPQTLTFQL